MRISLAESSMSCKVVSPSGMSEKYEKLSTDRSDCRLSFASPVGLLLSCNHIYNQPS